ncbi:hypothetical protein N7451_000361 [Penicillium sp. IBT 35674x]|nr:hypothetical protein N7451_000361 [Penicillium sp. IBT 35674x]
MKSIGLYKGTSKISFGGVLKDDNDVLPTSAWIFKQCPKEGLECQIARAIAQAPFSNPNPNSRQASNKDTIFKKIIGSSSNP